MSNVMTTKEIMLRNKMHGMIIQHNGNVALQHFAPNLVADASEIVALSMPLQEHPREVCFKNKELQNVIAANDSDNPDGATAVPIVYTAPPVAKRPGLYIVK